MIITIETEESKTTYDDVLDFFVVGTHLADKIRPMDFSNWSCNRRKLIGTLYYYLKRLEGEDFAEQYKLKKK